MRPSASLRPLRAAALLAAAFGMLWSQPGAAQVASPHDWVGYRPVLGQGDVVTLIVDEGVALSDRGERSGDTQRSQEAGMNGQVGARSLPAAGFGSGRARSERETRRMSQQSHLGTTVAVRIVEVLDDGRYLVEGTREIQVDGRSVEVSASGVLDGRDVSRDRVAWSSRMAEAQFTYTPQDTFRGRNPLTRFLGWIWP